MKNSYYLILIAALQLSFADSQSLASSLNVFNICAGDRKYINCNTTLNPQSIIITDAFYGIRNPDINQCVYSPGDCGEEIRITHCGYNNPSCYVAANQKRKLNQCGGKIASYLYLKYYCIPFSYPNNLNTYDICSTTVDITQPNGFLTSPQYPSFNPQNKLCVVKINVPTGKSINIWAVDSSLGIRDQSGNCINNYVRISDNTGTYDFCGTERKTFVSTFCSNQIYVSYLASDTPANSGFRGFKLYYETYNIPSTCTTQTPPYPESTTSVSTTTGLIPGQASPIYRLKICITQPPITIKAPSNTLIFVESVSYVVTPSGICEDSYSPTHCVAERPLPCNLASQCTFRLANVTVNECFGGKPVQYLYVTYRFIPTVSTSVNSMCNIASINGDSNQRGIIRSNGFPKYEKYADCTLRLFSLDPYKAFRFYVTNIAIEGPENENCISDNLNLNDGISTKSYCGGFSLQETFSYVSCSNNLTISYKTSGGSILGSFINRGFNGYYELINRPFACSSVSLPSTNQPSTSPNKPTVNPNSEVFSYVLSTDQNGVTKSCNFPFKYKNTMYSKCINVDQPNYWCSLTYDYDSDKQKGTCNLGFTSNVQFEICSRTFRKFTCPAGYLIYIVSAEYSVTTDKSCDYNKKKCSESAEDIIPNWSGKNTVNAFGSSKVLTRCSNEPADLTHIDYKCIPEKVDTLRTFEFCIAGDGLNNNTFSDIQGIIQTPNYPVFQSNLDCPLQFISNVDKLISVYAIFINLETVASNKECENYYIQINDEPKICGIKNTILIYQGCASNFKLKIKTGSNGYKGVKLFYEALPITSSTICPATREPTNPSTVPTTQPIIQPDYVINGISSPTQTKNLCVVGQNIFCPKNYSISVREIMYGISEAKNCFYTQGDCVSFQSLEGLDCAGKDSCYVPYKLRSLPECSNKFSNYIRFKYDCIPDFYSPVSMCSSTFTQSKGVISSPDFPNFSPNKNCEANINVKSGSLIKAYIKDMSIDPNCSAESLTFNSPQLQPIQYCGQVNSIFALETCSNTLKLNLITKDDTVGKRGVSVYYEEIPKPSGFTCPDLNTKTTTKPTTLLTTTQPAITPIRPSYYGFASSLMSVVGCESKKIGCEADHVMIVESSVYGVHKTNLSYCSAEPDDCQAVFSFGTTLCAGNQNCSITFTSRLTTVFDCEKRKADYFQIIYRCVPTKEAGSPLKPATEVSSSGVFTVSPGQSAIFQSPNYPTYPRYAVACKFNITIAAGNFLRVYLNTARFSGIGQNCSTAKDYLRISDGVDSYSYCTNTNNAKYLMQSRSNWISVEFATNPVVIPYYKGFQIYVQSYTNQIISTIPQPPRLTTSKPFVPPIIQGFASQIYHDEVCAKTEKFIGCPNDYIILIHEEYLVDTNNNGCFHGDNDCSQSTNILLTECSNKQNCTIYLPETEITRCQAKYADLLHFEYQCIPTVPLKGSKIYTCTDKEIVLAKNGILTSPSYPQYIAGFNLDDCSLKITPPAKNGIMFFIIDLSLSSSDLNKDTCNNSDYLLINDKQLCGSSLARLGYVTTDSKPIDFKFKSLTLVQLAQQQETLRGYKIYFESYEISDTTTTAQVKPTTVPNFVVVIRDTKSTADLFKYSLIVGIPVIVVLIALILVIIRFNASSESTVSNVKYSKDSADLNSFANPNSLYDNADLSRSGN